MGHRDPPAEGEEAKGVRGALPGREGRDGPLHLDDRRREPGRRQARADGARDQREDAPRMPRHRGGPPGRDGDAAPQDDDAGILGGRGEVPREAGGYVRAVDLLERRSLEADIRNLTSDFSQITPGGLVRNWS